MKTANQPNPEQLAAIAAYAEYHGKKWKEKLMNDWLTGRDSAFKNGYLLRQVRNQFGPEWLEEFK